MDQQVLEEAVLSAASVYAGPSSPPFAPRRGPGGCTIAGVSV